ncbi:MAG TPA: hypothetical protein VMR73_02335, partial [Candidatus Paceibacterota bacterium]|nr:hypothetical protein [Candidatus Paceibacterota bacterium]
MKNYWFKAKRYGWGWYPTTWQGWLVMLVWVALAVGDFLRINAVTHSGSDTLIIFVPQLIVLMFVLVLICFATGEKPRWQWGGQELPMPVVMKWIVGIFIFLLVAVCALDTLTYYVSHSTVVESPQTLPQNSASNLSTFSNPTYGFTIQYPNTFTATTTFAISYLLPQSWNIDAPEGTGEQIIDLQYPGSNNILSAEVRIGASKQISQVSSCTTLPQNLILKSQMINGAVWATFQLSDAAMSHFAVRKSYRIVRNGTCFAMDEVIYGVNPEVYSPQAVVPFVQAIAQTALDGII